MNIRKDTLANILFMLALPLVGIIAALLIPQFAGYKMKVQREEARREIVEIENALHKYREENGAFPTQDEGLKHLIRIKDKKGESYLSETAAIDPWNQPYHYIYPGTNKKTSFDVWSFGADGKKGGDGIGRDITNWGQ